MQSLLMRPQDMDVKALERTRKSSDFKLFLIVFVASLGLAPLLVLAGLHVGFGMVCALVLALGIALLTLRWPVFGLFVALSASVLIEESSLRLAPDLTDQLDVFSWPPSLQGMIDRPIGFLFLFILAVTVLYRLIKRQWPLRGGPIILPFSLFMLCVALGVAHGLVTGGQLQIIVIEVRPLWYLFITYLLAYNLFTRAKQLKAFFWIVIIGAGIKGLQGVYLVFFILGGSLQGHDELMAHEESFFFVALILLIALFCWHYRYRAQLAVALLVLIPVVISLVANQRRADYIALLLGLTVAWSLIFLIKPEKRGMLMVVALVTLIVGGAYVAAFYNNGSSLASPARSIVAIFHPNTQDVRDIQSNLYRIIENHDLKYTEQQNPILGAGFGKAFLTPWPLVDISSDDKYYLFIPHNTIYWLWMRLGPIGYLLLWFLFGSIIIRGCLIVRNMKHSYLQMVGIYIVALTVMEIVVSFADYQLFFYRNVIYMGLLIGILMKLPAIEQNEMPIPVEKALEASSEAGQGREKRVIV
ncbi:MAG TPA: O-antigen ligase family protein [Ktedonobacteraceae bacterium]